MISVDIIQFKNFTWRGITSRSIQSNTGKDRNVTSQWCTREKLYFIIKAIMFVVGSTA